MRKRESSEKIPLQQQFENPLQFIGPLEVENETKATNKLEEIENNLNSKGDWDLRSNSILEAMALLKGGIQKYGIDFSSISTGIANCVSDLRSTLVRNGTLFIAACAQELKKSYITSTDVILPALAKQLSHGTAIISESCHLAILQISIHVQNRRVMRVIQTLANSRSSIQRQVAAEAFQLFVRNWKEKVLTKNESDIKASLTKLSKDSSELTRKIAKTALKELSDGSKNEGNIKLNIKSTSAPLYYQPSIHKPKTAMHEKREYKKETEFKGPMTSRTPNFTRKRSSLRAPSTVKETLNERNNALKKMYGDECESMPSTKAVSHMMKSPKRSFIPDLQPKNDNEIMRKNQLGELGDYMPPNSVKTAKQFIAVLLMIIEEDRYDEIAGLEMLLPQAIIAGTLYISSIGEWKTVLKPLYRKYRIDFKEEAKELIIAFHFHPWIVSLSVACFGNDYITSLFTDDPLSLDSYEFFVSYLTVYHDRDLSEDVIQFISKVIIAQKNINDVEILQKFINKKPTDENLSLLICKRISKGQDYRELLSQLLYSGMRTHKQIQKINEDLNNVLPNMLSSQYSEQVYAVMDFIIELIAKSDEIMLDSILDQILSLCCSKDSKIQEKATTCLTALTINQEFLLNLISHINELAPDSQEVLVSLKMVTECLSDMNADQLLLFIDVVTPVLDSLFNSEIPGNTREAVNIASIFKSHVPQTFDSFFQELSPANQKLIEMKVSKETNLLRI